tara:strand:- start:259 stop:555 length:297 start_codon:yes stop_codon:yes gene_type:complete
MPYGKSNKEIQNAKISGFKMRGFSGFKSSPIEQNEHAPSDTTGRASFDKFLEEYPYETGKTFKTGPSEFETAFSTARKSGKSEFTFKDKKYTTKIKGE